MGTSCNTREEAPLNQKMELRHWAILICIGTMFASSFVFHRVAVPEIPTITITAVRSILASIISLIMLRAMSLSLPPLGRGWLPLMFLGVMQVAIPFLLVAWGMQYVKSGLAGILMSVGPIYTVLLAHFFTKDERFTPLRSMGVLLGMGGVIVLIGPSALEGFGEHLLGQMAIMGAPFCYTIVSLFVRRQRGTPVIVLSGGQYVIATFLLTPFALLLDDPLSLRPSWEAMAAVLAIAIVSTAFPTFLTFWLVQQVGATNTSLLSYIIPVVAVAQGAALLGEWLEWQALLGMALILAGALLVGSSWGRRAIG